MRKLLLLLLFCAGLSFAQVDVTSSGGTSPVSYTTLKGAFDAINLGTHTGTIDIGISASTTETAACSLNASGSGAASYTTIAISPTGVGGWTISGNITTGGSLIYLNGADNVTIDGRVGRTGTTKALTINNTAAGSNDVNTIRFIADATSDSVKYCTVKGNNNAGAITAGGTAGVILFATASAGGNDNNSIDNCDIDCQATAKAGIVSIGTSGNTNSGIAITNCNIYDFYISNSSTASTAGIVFGSQTASCSASGNSLYQTASRQYVGGTSVIHYGILINNANGSYYIRDNYIGGSAAQCGGSAWTTTQTNTTANGYRLWAIDLETSVTGTNVISKNTIKNLDISTTYSSSGSTGIVGIIVQGGSANIDSNTIGSTSATSNILINCTAATGGGGLIMGISTTVASGSMTFSIQGNNIGGIKTTATTTTVYWNVYAINTSTTTGSHTVNASGNTIGSTSVANSIENTSGSGLTSNTQFNLRAMNLTAGACTINNNTIANISQSTTSGAGGTGTKPTLSGIYASGTTVSHNMSGNVVRDLKSASSNYNTGTTCAIMAIFANGTLAADNTITGNTIYNIYCTNTSVGTAIYGLYVSTATARTHVISKNYIHTLYMATSSASALVYGMHFTAGGTTTCSNNIVALGYDGSGTEVTSPHIYIGISDNTGTENYYYNSVFLGGTNVTGATATYAFNSSVTTNTRIFTNNIFVNNRSNGSGTGKHYAVKYGGSTVYPSGLSANNNLFYAGGTGGVLGFFNSADRTTLAAWVTATGRDFNSVSAPVTFMSNTNLHIDTTNANCWNVLGMAAPITGIADEYDRTNVRSTTLAGGMNCIGADQFTTNTSPAATSITGTIADAGTTTYEHAGRTVASITWHANSGTLPSAASVTYYPGQVPPGASTAYGYGYWVLSVTGGTYNYNYDLTMNYDSAAVNTLTESNMKLYVDLNKLSSSTVSNVFRGRNLSIAGITHSAGTYAIGDNTSPLPVELSTLNAVVRGSTVNVKWETATEQNAASFVVERKIANGNWLNAGTVKAAGNSNAPKSYTFAERNVAAGSYQYRLKMVDNDGSFKYSASVNAEVGVPAEFTLSQNYPNPFNPATTVEFALPTDSRVTLEVFNVAGEKVLTVLNGNMNAGFHSVSVNGVSLNSGIYFYRLSAGSFVQTRKMMLVK